MNELKLGKGYSSDIAGDGPPEFQQHDNSRQLEHHQFPNPIALTFNFVTRSELLRSPLSPTLIINPDGVAHTVLYYTYALIDTSDELYAEMHSIHFNTYDEAIEECWIYFGGLFYLIQEDPFLSSDDIAYSIAYQQFIDFFDRNPRNISSINGNNGSWTNTDDHEFIKYCRVKNCTAKHAHPTTKLRKRAFANDYYVKRKIKKEGRKDKSACGDDEVPLIDLMECLAFDNNFICKEAFHFHIPFTKNRSFKTGRDYLEAYNEALLGDDSSKDDICIPCKPTVVDDEFIDNFVDKIIDTPNINESVNKFGNNFIETSKVSSKNRKESRFDNKIIKTKEVKSTLAKQIIKSDTKVTAIALRKGTMTNNSRGDNPVFVEDEYQENEKHLTPSSEPFHSTEIQLPLSICKRRESGNEGIEMQDMKEKKPKLRESEKSITPLSDDSTTTIVPLGEPLSFLEDSSSLTPIQIREEEKYKGHALVAKNYLDNLKKEEEKKNAITLDEIDDIVAKNPSIFDSDDDSELSSDESIKTNPSHVTLANLKDYYSDEKDDDPKKDEPIEVFAVEDPPPPKINGPYIPPKCHLDTKKDITLFYNIKFKSEKTFCEKYFPILIDLYEFLTISNKKLALFQQISGCNTNTGQVIDTIQETSYTRNFLCRVLSLNWHFFNEKYPSYRISEFDKVDGLYNCYGPGTCYQGLLANLSIRYQGGIPVAGTDGTYWPHCFGKIRAYVSDLDPNYFAIENFSCTRDTICHFVWLSFITFNTLEANRPIKCYSKKINAQLRS